MAKSNKRPKESIKVTKDLVGLSGYGAHLQLQEFRGRGGKFRDRRHDSRKYARGRVRLDD